MRNILKRKSVVAFLFICATGLFAPLIAPCQPRESVGAPFARPLWWNRILSVSREIKSDENGVTLLWQSSPPAVFSLKGKVASIAGETAVIAWRSPDSRYVLAEISGSHWLNMDGRDMIFKQKLNFPAISDSTEYLFPVPGVYALEISGAKSADLTLSLPGRRQGLLGTDQRGRDVFSLLIYGIRTSLIVGVSATIIASLLGLGFGLAAGYVGGLTDAVIMRIVDMLLSIPTLPILMVFAGTWGKGLWQLVVVLSVFSWMGTARSVRALTLSLRESPWIEGLKALGANRMYILRRHLVPATAPILFANIALGVPGAILSEAGLAFLGLSDPRLISWGRMLHEAHVFGAFTEGAWWLLLPPGFAVVTICLIFMDMGRYLEEKIDPRLEVKKS